MNGIWQRISAEPAVVTGAVVASLNVTATFRVWTPTPEQLAAINTALVAIFALLVRATVHHGHGTPVKFRRSGPRPARKPASPPGKPASPPRKPASPPRKPASPPRKPASPPRDAADERGPARHTAATGHSVGSSR